MRILSYNIHKGFNFSNTQYLLEEIRYGIRQTNADIVFLQEVVGHSNRREHHIAHREAQQFEYLADSVWPHHAYGKNALYAHGHHGNALLSRYPFETVHNHDVSVSWVPLSHRGILYGKVQPDIVASKIHLLCLHFGLFAFERRHQISELCESTEKILPSHEPLIIAGDFNDWSLQADKQLRKRLGLREAILEKTGKHARSFPSYAPLLAMDRIYYRNLTLVDADVLYGTPWSRLSDHCALFAEFKI